MKTEDKRRFIMSAKVLGVIGGSGLYEMEGLTDLQEEVVATPLAILLMCTLPAS